MTTASATTESVKLPKSQMLIDPPNRRERLFVIRQIIIYGLLVLGGALVLIPFFWMVAT